MDWMSLFLSTFGVVFAIVDPFGYVPTFLAMTASDSQERRRFMLKRACVAAFIFLAIFTFFGNSLLKFFGISIPALQISGGLILLFIGFEMLKVMPVKEKILPSEESDAVTKEDISIVPLAIPMLSGPASGASVVVLSSRSESLENYAVILFSIFLTLVITYLILRSADKILKRIGQTGLNVMSRVMGLLLTAMAAQFIIDGYRAVRL